MKQIHQIAWKFGNQNLMVTCTLIFEVKFGALLEVHFGKKYISFQISKSKKSNILNSVQIKTKTRKLCIFEAN